jgi:DNA primase
VIDQLTVDRILSAADVVDVVKDFVSLKKRGVNYIGLCPFHNEKTPSFNVSPSKGIFKCFGCGKAGNSVGFIMEHEQLTYVEALKFLARKYNIEVEERELTADELKLRNERESLMVVVNWAQRYFTDTLHKHSEGKSIGLSYLRERGLRDDTIEKFQLGYCLEQRDAMTQAALREGYKLEYLVKTGLSIPRDEGEAFDRFQGRVMFPIHSLSGRVIAFGGRIMKADKKMAKYVNSPESDVYHKSSVLYGIFQAKKAITQENKCFLVEGYTDVISLHQAGIENVVASSGTALTPDQIRLIKRFTPNITVLYDGDPAGIKASLRGIDLILEEGLNVKVVLLPEGEDPDSYARSHGAVEVLGFIANNETDFIHFKTSLLLKDAERDPIQKANLISDIVRSIGVIPDPVTREVYIKECTRLLKVDEALIYSEVAKKRRQLNEKGQQPVYASFPVESKPKTPVLPSYIDDVFCEVEEKELLYYLLKFGNVTLFQAHSEPGEEDVPAIAVDEYIINELQTDDLEFKNLIYKKVFDEYRLKMHDGAIDNRYFINHSDKEISQLAINLLTTQHQLSRIWTKHHATIPDESDMLTEAVPKAVLVYKAMVVKAARLVLQKHLEQANPDSDIEKFNQLLMQNKEVNDIIKDLSKQLGRHRF